MCLDIDNKVYFYDAEFINPKYSAYKTSETMQFVTRKKGSQENIMLLEDFNHNYYRVKTSDIMNWKLTDNYKTVENHRLQKATTSFGGSKNGMFGFVMKYHLQKDLISLMVYQFNF